VFKGLKQKHYHLPLTNNYRNIAKFTGQRSILSPLQALRLS